ncbi:PREDICTED: thermospermine synthase [Prunus dulcis]|uniref:PREDICTED: thermospermine synthase n=1 Tax=Prunus dulcis TaxID=3755 RepID=A0A5E4E5L4_PRUDU|nr:PREDICTED: thermospermine synthase [Prunus dulcis]
MAYNSVIYNAFGRTSPASSPTRIDVYGRRSGKQKKVVAGKWCGKVWMSNQVHPYLAKKNPEEEEHRRFYVPLPPEDQFSEFELIPEEDDYQNPPIGIDRQQHAEWFEEQLEADLKWSFALNGYALVIDGKLQSAERVEFIYHECLVHPALLLHDNPKTVFIMGGGEGSTARESLKHKDVDKVIMCDINQE